MEVVLQIRLPATVRQQVQIKSRPFFVLICATDPDIVHFWHIWDI